MRALSIYIKLIIYFLAISLLPMIGLSFLAFSRVSEAVREDNQRILYASSVDTAYKIERELRQRITELRSWSTFPVTERALTAGKTDELVTLFDRLITAYSAYDLLVLLDAEKKILALNSLSSDGEKLETGDLAQMPLDVDIGSFQKSTVGVYLSGFYRSDMVKSMYGTEGESLVIAVPVTDTSGQILGYLVGYLNWGYLQEILDIVQAALADEFYGTVFMIEYDTHKLIAHRNTGLYGEQYLFEVDLAKKVDQERAGFFEYNWPVLKTIGYAQVRLREGLPSPPWLVCVEAANDVIYSKVYFLRDLFLLLTLAAALFIVIIVYFISRRFTKPLLRLVAGAQSIAAGNMQVEMSIDSVDEIGILASAFNQMSDALRERDEELKQKNIQLEEANRLKSEFLANMSHELRTPMNSIIGFTNLILQRSSDKLPEQQCDNLVKVRKNAFQLLDLLNSILDLSKIEAGSMELMLEEFSLRGVLEGCMGTITPMVAGRNVELKLDEMPADVFVKQDRQKLRQIILNLLGNAIKFTKEGHIRAGFIRVDQADEQLPIDLPPPFVKIWIEDTGIGIHQKDIETIFSEFRQVDGSPTRRYGGTGLGLAISKKLAKMLDGDIFVESEVGCGSTFTVVLPVHHPGIQGVDEDENEAETGTDNPPKMGGN